jgi:hypothetical protein
MDGQQTHRKIPLHPELNSMETRARCRTSSPLWVGKDDAERTAFFG